MNKTALLAAASTLALTASVGSAAPTLHGFGAYHQFHQFHMPKNAKPILYDQNNDYASDYIVSMNDTSGVYSAYDSQAADDFVVPSGATWKVTGVDVSGSELCTCLNPASETVIFYMNNRNNKPGKAVKAYTVTGTYSGGNIAITLPTAVKLTAGTYWVSVAANVDFQNEGPWYWNDNATLHGNPAMWRNPVNGWGTGCQRWETIDSCTGTPAPDLMFDLRGTSSATGVSPIVEQSETGQREEENK